MYIYTVERVYVSGVRMSNIKMLYFAMTLVVLGAVYARAESSDLGKKVVCDEKRLCPEGYRCCEHTCCPSLEVCCYSLNCCSIDYSLGIPVIRKVSRGVKSIPIVSHG